MTKQVRQFGTWSSPISPRSLAGALRLDDVQWDGTTLVWLEGRGAQGVLVAQSGVDAPRDLTSDLSVRARVGYGGGDFTVSGGQVYFAGPGGRLYRLPLAGGSAHAITPGFGEAAAPRVSPDGRWLAFVHTYERDDVLALVDTEGHLWPRKLASGTDFVMQPAWHPQGTHLAYIAWNHPQMPWDGTELRLLTLEMSHDQPLVATTGTIAGSSTVAIFQPEFSPDGRYLSYVSDETGWNQLYLYDLTDRTHRQLTTDEADHGAPAWVQGVRTYGWSGDSRSLVYIKNVQGFEGLWRYDLRSSQSSRVKGLEDYTDLAQVAVSPEENLVAVIAASTRIPPRIVTTVFGEPDLPPRLASDPTEPPTIQVLVDEGARIHRRSAAENVPLAQLAEGQPVSWAGHDGETVYGLYYPPASDRFTGTGAPPLIVHVHGGPTSQARAGYSAAAQFFATRGYGFLMVNYRGSTGYGKDYMNKLRGHWGIYDVEDAATGASALAQQGKADPSRLVIMGGSAGGFTVLQSLVQKPGFYKAAVCAFGVSNQFALASDTHKFEERYTDSLLGPLPDAAALYRERSPIFHASKIVDPIAVFQGEDDQVVPRNQSDSIVESLRARGVPHIYHVYSGEGHGWRKPETIEHYYNTVLAFLKQYVLYA
ncbi:MAG: S9 family peptidase [Chloroflexi bacterium]|nr:S9 family peptidase [Chloroflexota bacterium]